MVDISARSRRPTPWVRALDTAVGDVETLDPADTLSFTDWFNTPSPLDLDPATGPLPRIDRIPASRVAAEPVGTEDAADSEDAAGSFDDAFADVPLAAGSRHQPVEDRPAADQRIEDQPADRWVEAPATGPLPFGELPVVGLDPIPVPGDDTLATSAGAVWTEPPAVPEPGTSLPIRVGTVGGPLARATVLAAMMALVGGAGTALAMDKQVTVTVDGQDRILHTYAADVEGALDAAGLAPAPQDRVEPGPLANIADGDHIVFDRARRLTLVDGGGERSVWTTQNSVQEALRALGLRAAPTEMSAAPDAAIPLAGMSLQLRVPRSVTVTDGTGAPQQITTTAGTVAGLLAERGIELGPDDVSTPSGDASLTDGATVQVVRNGTGEIVETRRIAPPEKVVEDPTLPRGEKVVVVKGKPGEQMAIMRVSMQNGREVRREQIRAGGSTAPTPRVVKLGTSDDPDVDEKTKATDDGSTDAASGNTDANIAAANKASGQAADGAAGGAAAATPKVSGGAVWDKLAKCESTGNWAVNSGNGYYGGLQFDAGTWKAYGGDDFAALPHKASRAEQIAVANKVRNDRGGYSAWPACSRKLGLPQ